MTFEELNLKPGRSLPTDQEQPMQSTTRGLAFDFGQTHQNVDQSVTYNITNPESAGAKVSDFLTNNPNLIYYLLGGLALVGFVVLARGKKRK